MQSKIATNTNLIAFSRDGRIDMTQSIPLLAKGGFDTLDLNFCEMMNSASPLNDERAKEYINKLKELKKEYKLNYFQCHLPYPRDGKENDESDRAILKAIGYATELEIPVAVIHPIKGSVSDNISYLRKFLSKCDDITLAVENMESEEEIHSATDLLMLTSSLDRTGICLDVGHANILALDIPSFIKSAGVKLIATHIADNNGISDLHLLPGMGNIDWENAMKAFKESYSGYINYEAMYFGRNLPSSFREETIRLAKKIGTWLLTL